MADGVSVDPVVFLVAIIYEPNFQELKTFRETLDPSQEKLWDELEPMLVSAHQRDLGSLQMRHEVQSVYSCMSIFIWNQVWRRMHNETSGMVFPKILNFFHIM